MTLCIAWIESVAGQERIVAVSDRRVTGGACIDLVPKIHLFDKANCLLCWEGDTNYIPHLIQATRSLLDSDPSLSAEVVTSEQLLDAIMKRMNHFWKSITNLPQGQQKPNPDDIGSFIFGCYDYDRSVAVLQSIWLDPTALKWEIRSVNHIESGSHLKFRYIGSGGSYVESTVKLAAITPAYLIAAFKDAMTYDHSVGGIPQVVVLDRRGCVSYGIQKNGKKYIDGFELSPQDVISKTVQFLDYDDLQP